jgi:Spy/CpxP family protein refolding chaperone
MAGKMSRLIAFVVMAGVGIGAAAAQAPADAPPEKHPGWAGGPGPHRGGPDGQQFENVRKAIEALTPEQRKRFQENFLRWANLPPEEKKALADRESFRRKKIAEDIEAAITESGLNLNSEQRELFTKRYAEERRKIEEQLHKEMDEKRRPLLKDVIAKLRAEFAEGRQPPPSATPDPGAAKP